MAEDVNTARVDGADETARMTQPTEYPEMPTEAVAAQTAPAAMPAEQIEVPTAAVEIPTAAIEAPAPQVESPAPQVEPPAPQVEAPTARMDIPAAQAPAPSAPTAEIPVPAPPVAPVADPYPAPAATAPMAAPVAAPYGFDASAAGYAGGAAASGAYAQQAAQPASPVYQQQASYQDPYQGAYQSPDYDAARPIPPYTPAGEAPLTELTGGMKFAWLVIGFLLTIPGMILAWLVNVDKRPQVKKDAITWAVIGFSINAAIGLIACLAFAGIVAAAMYGGAANGGYAGLIGGLFL